MTEPDGSVVITASGGTGGIRHLLQHIGPAQREWARDLGAYPETDDYIEPMAAGVNSKLAQRAFPEMLRQRDAGGQEGPLPDPMMLRVSGPRS